VKQALMESCRASHGSAPSARSATAAAAAAAPTALVATAAATAAAAAAAAACASPPDPAALTAHTVRTTVCPLCLRLYKRGPVQQQVGALSGEARVPARSPYWRYAVLAAPRATCHVPRASAVLALLEKRPKEHPLLPQSGGGGASAIHGRNWQRVNLSVGS
jgi:hypothetical protein